MTFPKRLDLRAFRIERSRHQLREHRALWFHFGREWRPAARLNKP
jgi:hypothetical protein